MQCGGKSGSVSRLSGAIAGAFFKSELFYRSDPLVEQIVDFALGFVICGLIGLAFLPVVSARARRLTLARVNRAFR